VLHWRSNRATQQRCPSHHYSSSTPPVARYKCWS
jgi:hypothetical protein